MDRTLGVARGLLHPEAGSRPARVSGAVASGIPGPGDSCSSLLSHDAQPETHVAHGLGHAGPQAASARAPGGAILTFPPRKPCKGLG